jgi:hypothetical protein
MSDHPVAVADRSPRRRPSGSRRGWPTPGRSVIVLALLAAAIGALAPPASANDASVRRAFKTYEKKLTKDISYLASFKTPTRRSSGTVLKHVAGIRRDLRGAERAQKGKRASTAKGRTGRQQILTALSDANSAAGQARASALAIRGGHRAAARGDARKEQRIVNKAIALFEAGGKKLHLF